MPEPKKSGTAGKGKKDTKKTEDADRRSPEPIEQSSQASGSGNNSPVPASSLPVRKRKQAMASAQRASEEENEPKSIIFSIPEGLDKQTSSVSNFGEEDSDSSDDDKLDDDHDDKEDSKAAAEGGKKGGGKSVAKTPTGKAREIRLEQNRKAARESRRRKKMMIEELQRSVIFFSKRNAVLKKENEDLTRMLMQAQAQIQVQGGNASQVANDMNKQNQQQAAAQGKQEVGQHTGTAVPSASEQQEAADAQAQQNQALQQMLMNQLNAASAMQAAQSKGADNSGQAGNGGKPSDLQAAALQAMAAARNILPSGGMGGFGLDAQSNHLQNPFGQFAGQQNAAALQQLQAGQQFLPMQLGQAGAAQGLAGMATPGAPYGIPFPYGAMPQQHLFSFPGAGAPGMPNLLQQQLQQQAGQQQQQQQQGGQH